MALAGKTADSATKHLVRDDRQEDLCFAVYFPSQGTNRLSGLIHELILPGPGDRMVHGNASFNACYFDRAVSIAVERRGGLAFFHSHPFPGWQDMSRDDIAAEDMLARRAQGATGLPLLGATVGSDGAWSARFWIKKAPNEYRREWCESVRVVGEQLRITFNDRLNPPPKANEAQLRTVSAWGPKNQATISRLRYGVIGGGSVGTIVAEGLVRTGGQDGFVMDFDRVTHKNRDRLMFSSPGSADRAEFKVRQLLDALRSSATGTFRWEPSTWSVCEEQGFRQALDCDVLFSCVDRPWPRAVLNLIAKAHLIPVIDGGVYLRTNSDNSALRHADWMSATVVPGSACLECLGQITPDLVALECSGELDDPVYIAGLPDSHPAKRRENTFAFSLAAAGEELLQLIALVVAPNYRSPRPVRHRFVTDEREMLAKGCNPGCFYQSVLAKGDHCGVSFTGRHRRAEQIRNEAVDSEDVIRFFMG